MSAGDQAFIRAYAKEAKTAYRGDARAESTLPQQPPQSSDSIPAPHGAFTAAATSPPTHTSPQGSNPSMPQGSNAPVMQESIAPAPQVEISPVQMPGSTLPTSQWRIDARDASGPSANLPLSAYSLPTPVEPEFRPSYEVDRFIWPATCDKMLASAGESFDQLADMLIDVARRRDCKVIAVTGCRRNEGRSLMMLTLG